jgi:hypothetical protein
LSLKPELGLGFMVPSPASAVAAGIEAPPVFLP